MSQYYLGVDIGSLTTKVVIVNQQGQMVDRATGRSGYSGKEVALRLSGDMLVGQGLDRKDIVITVATGYGRVTFPADREVSEITCQARGIGHLFGGARTVIDIGGQDSKAIRMLPGGKVVDFAMNDKCAAGTGRFLEVMAGALEVPLEDVGDLSVGAAGRCNISSFWTVCAESEVISHVASGASKADILAGVCESVATRVASMTSRTGLEPEVVFTGGVARNKGVASALSRHLGLTLLLPEEPEITAALGAALFAREIGSR